MGHNSAAEFLYPLPHAHAARDGAEQSPDPPRTGGSRV